MNRPKLHTPIKSMRLKCLDCCCGSSNEIKFCPSIDCPLWCYRFGRRPSKDTLKALFDAKPYASHPSGVINHKAMSEEDDGKF